MAFKSLSGIIFYVQVLLINLVSNLNLEVYKKVKLSALIGLNYALLKPNMAQMWRKPRFSRTESSNLYNFYA